jgi:hypothetical protein
MNVWIFGDSFAHDYGIDYQWVNRLKDHYTVHNCAVEGSSLAFSYSEFDSERCNIHHGDAIIFVATNIERKWFVEDAPQNSLRYVHQQDDIGRAARQYWLYLHNSRVDEVMFVNFIYSLELLTIQKNLTSMVLNVNWETEAIMKKTACKSLIMSERTLHSIQLNEYADQACDYWRTQAKIDTKPNHLLQTNHMILYKSIVDCISNNKPLAWDRKKFLTEIITKQLIDQESHDWITM